MNRIAASVKANPRRALTALSAAAIASIAVVGSGANYNSVSANPGNTAEAGTLTHSNSKNSASIFAISGLRPGGPSQNGSVTITNTGNIPGAFKVSKSDLTNSDGANPLSAKLDLEVEDMTDPGNPVEKYEGKLGAMGELSLGTYAAGEAHPYRFTVTMPDAGGAAGSDNVYQGDNTSLKYNWESTSP